MRRLSQLDLERLHVLRTIDWDQVGSTNKLERQDVSLTLVHQWVMPLVILVHCKDAEWQYSQSGYRHNCVQLLCAAASACACFVGPGDLEVRGRHKSPRVDRTVRI
jgi:hypothetical protein